ncbi:hypothetical protein PFISCL1PPCAC_22298, partial [Pristionchus fissidentatus]
SRQKMDSLHTAMKEKMRESMMKNLDEKATMNLRIETLEKLNGKLEKELESARATIENLLATQPAPEMKDETTQTVDSD